MLHISPFTFTFMTHGLLIQCSDLRFYNIYFRLSMCSSRSICFQNINASFCCQLSNSLSERIIWKNSQIPSLGIGLDLWHNLITLLLLCLYIFLPKIIQSVLNLKLSSTSNTEWLPLTILSLYQVSTVDYPVTVSGIREPICL